MMETQEPSSPRPLTPDSSLADSLYLASNTIDDLTTALSNFSRITSPELPVNLICCCGSEDCENLLAWLDLKTKLESRLTLSAEVGQALLQRHEAYVRRHETNCRINQMRKDYPVDKNDEDEDITVVFREDPDVQYAGLMKEKAALEKRLNQALVNAEVTEVSNKTLLQELQEARATISRLTAHHARSIGWDTRVTTALKERDDMQQERDSESQRARLAESRFAALKDKTVKLQAEVRRLQEALEEKRSHRLESSEMLIHNVRTRLDSICKAEEFHTVNGYEEINRILESLVQDNETLKHDNGELQHFLTEAREELDALQGEVEEYRANLPVLGSGANTPYSRHRHGGSITSISINSDRKVRRPMDSFASDNHNLLSPTDSSSSKFASRYSPSRLSFELESPNDEQETLFTPEKRRTHKPLFLLSRSCGVQTDPLPPSFSSSLSPFLDVTTSIHDRSETSSFSESSSLSQMASLMERIVSLLNRIVQSDPLTLTNRLKRQHLKGADINHLSKSTITNILNEVNNLRSQYRSFLEEEKASILFTRKDLRTLFKFLKDIFTELGQVRITLNEIILDPSIAPKVRDRALHPEQEQTDSSLATPTNSLGISWISPISRLFSQPPGTEPLQPPAPSQQTNPKGRGLRAVPKRGPALAASATTVNVEFSGVGGRTTTSTFAAPISIQRSSTEGTSGVMDIFAGAPQPNTTMNADNWVMVSSTSGPKRKPSFMRLGRWDDCYKSTLKDETTTTNNEIPRNVAAVVDEAGDQVPPLLERTLKRRGLSDSSIHSTFSAHGSKQGISGQQVTNTNTIRGPRSVFKGAWPDRSSVLHALSRTVQNLKLSGTNNATPDFNVTSAPNNTIPSLAFSKADSAKTDISPPTSPAKPVIIRTAPSNTPHNSPPRANKTAANSPRGDRLAEYPTWAASSLLLDSPHGSILPDAYMGTNVVGSLREESFLRRTPHTHDAF